MNEKLMINPGETLIQIDEKVYKISDPHADLLGMYGRKERVEMRMITLARKYGTDFNGFDEVINCLKCRYSDITPIAIESARTRRTICIEGGDMPCFYDGNVDIVAVYKSANNDSNFMAKIKPCTIADAFHRALMEQGYLDSFLLEGVEPGAFHYIREFVPGGELEASAFKEYALLLDAASRSEHSEDSNKGGVLGLEMLRKLLG
ncbi:MAG: hypothetical protein HZB67_03995 [Candidatus Aenigmarchaeota archaeon]|nr:hypothetical protein [Candidatus Aenigmarchaeota archaeon]